MGKSQRVNPTRRRTQIPNQIPFYYSVPEDLRKKDYYIHTEKYSPKSYVVNFVHKLVLVNQRSERWFSHVKK